MMAGRAWWRAYAEAAHDPKLQRLPAPLFRHWFNLCCLCASQTPNELPAIEDVALWLRCRVSTAVTVLNELHRRGLLDQVGDRYTPHNWQGRQYVSDSSTQRVQRFRERQRNVPGNAPEQSRAEQSSGALCAPPPQANGQPKKGTRLPDDWRPTAADLDYAHEHGLNGQQLDNQVERFRNHWTSKPGKDALKLNWARTWKNWVLGANTPSKKQTDWREVIR